MFVNWSVLVPGPDQQITHLINAVKSNNANSKKMFNY